MNISSIVVNLQDKKHLENVKIEISKIKECEVVAHKDENIVVVVSSKDMNSQIAVFKTLKSLSGVNDVAMVYNYDDLETDYENLKNAPLISEILDDEFDPKNIKYSGTPKI